MEPFLTFTDVSVRRRLNPLMFIGSAIKRPWFRTFTATTTRSAAKLLVTSAGSNSWGSCYTVTTSCHIVFSSAHISVRTCMPQTKVKQSGAGCWRNEMLRGPAGPCTW